ncbi:MAG: 1-acyl-sn-glycerol-3-phosphate acyltransferase [Pseudomonadales bacterium]|jgi:hypothetical protein|nr:1-acyl-sn-glycerol-3-phosphate acyltransferase [Pseudomonadales bacterium]
MSSEQFEHIRPYRDEEMQGVFARLLADRELLDALLTYRHPRLAALAPGPMRWLAAAWLRRRTARLHTIDDFQSSLKALFDHLIARTTRGFTWSGLDALDPERPYLFVSNHRDIAMDSAFVNYATHAEGFGTVRIAIGDNLLKKDFVTDLMRLNKSFVVQRSFKGPKDQLAAFRRTSAYLHHSIGVDAQSVWIAQREGRAKDGDDRTDPAILKMFFVSQRKSGRSFPEVLADLHVVPVAVSYELDPCAPMKAHELCVREARGAYEKPEDEDLRSIVAGIRGEKGRVHVHFGAELTAPPADPDAAAAEIDRSIHAGYRLWPTNLEAARRSGIEVPAALARAVGDGRRETMQAFEAALVAAPERERPWLLKQYAQPVRARTRC